MENFKPYLEAVIKSGDRTRTFIYVMILINFCILTVVLNSIAPDWNDVRLNRLETVLACSDSSTKDEECQSALDYAMQRGFDLSSKNTSAKAPNALPTSETMSQLRVAINYYIQKSIDENSFHIPIFNVQLDVNDLWVLSGILNCYLMFLLVTCFDREYDDLKLALKKISSSEDAELILSTQMFGKPSNGITARVINNTFKLSVIFGPFLVHSRVVWRCFSSSGFRIYNDLAGRTTAILILVFCGSSLIILLYLGGRALKTAIEIEHLVAAVENKLQTSAAVA